MKIGVYTQANRAAAQLALTLFSGEMDYLRGKEPPEEVRLRLRGTAKDGFLLLANESGNKPLQISRNNIWQARFGTERFNIVSKQIPAFEVNCRQVIEENHRALRFPALPELAKPFNPVLSEPPAAVQPKAPKPVLDHVPYSQAYKARNVEVRPPALPQVDLPKILPGDIINDVKIALAMLNEVMEKAGNTIQLRVEGNQVKAAIVKVVTEDL